MSRLRGNYSRFYQAPPLNTVSGPLLDLAVSQGFAFLPLKGERDEQHEVGLAIPFKSWTGDVTYFRTGARNFFDHDVIGDSNIFLPLTIDHVRIRGVEVSVRSPKLFQHANASVVYSHQSVEGQGGVTGGLTDFSPPATGSFFLDHDQRDTLHVNLRTDLPHKSWAALVVNYGSGFMNGNGTGTGPRHLPAYATVDVALGKSIGEQLSAKLTVTNISDKRYQIDLSNTFGGSHTNEARAVSVQVRYRFRY